jgi:O-antigen/teichoic acid export membrane protein
VLLNWNLPDIVGLLVLSSVLAALAYWLLCTRAMPSLKAVPVFDQAEFRRLLRFGAWITLSTTLSPILVYLDRFVVARLISIEAVAYYTAPYEMVTRLWIIPASLVATLFPAFSTLRARREREVLQTIISRSIKYLLLALAPIVIILYAFAHDVLQLWLGSGFADASTATLRILCVGVLVNSLAQIPYALIQAFDRPDVTAKFHLIELPLHVVLVWVLVRTIGIGGAALAWTLRVTLDAGLLFGAAGRFGAVSRRSLVAYRIPQTLAVLGLLTWTTLALAAFVTVKSLRMGMLALVLGALGGLVWRYLLDDEDRARIKSLPQVVGRARSR